jgi:hypothetical protein
LSETIDFADGGDYIGVVCNAQASPETSEPDCHGPARCQWQVKRKKGTMEAIIASGHAGTILSLML